MTWNFILFDIGDVRRSSLIIIIIIYYLFLIVYNVIMKTRFPIRVYHGSGRSSCEFFSTPSRSSTHCSGRAVLTHENEFWRSCLFFSSAAVTTVGRKIVLPVFRRKLRHCACASQESLELLPSVILFLFNIA